MRAGRPQGSPLQQPRAPSGRVLGLKIHRNPVDAVPQMGGRRAVVEDMAEMTAAPAAVDFGAGHAVAPVDRGFDRTFRGIVEARPAGAAVEFLLRHEQWLGAPRTYKGAVAFFVIERAASRRLGAVLAHDLVLLRREQPSPFLVGMGDGVALGFHDRSWCFLPRM